MINIDTVPVTLFYQNCRIIYDDSRAAVVCDPGGDVEEIMAHLEKQKLTCVFILLTHAHLDHIGGAAEISRLTGAPIVGPAAEDRFLITHMDDQASGFGMPRSEGFTPEFVKDGQTVKLLPELEMQVIATPGHTPGGVCYYSEQEKILLSGDTLFAGSIGRTDFPRGSLDDLLNSIRKKLLVLPDDTQVLSGHGPDTTIAREKNANEFLKGFYQ